MTGDRTVRTYKAVRNMKIEDANLFSAWTMYFYKDETHGWRELRNYNMRSALKGLAVASGKAVFITTSEELNNN
jgi:predicted RNA-binding protein with PUA-like domain